MAQVDGSGSGERQLLQERKKPQLAEDEEPEFRQDVIICAGEAFIERALRG